MATGFAGDQLVRWILDREWVSLGSMLEFPRPVLWAHRFLYAGIILAMAPSFWRTVLQPVIMLSDFPVTVLALTVTLAGFVFCWLKGKTHWLLVLFDTLLIAMAALYFLRR